MKVKGKVILSILVLLVCLAMVVLGQRNVGYQGLVIQLLGLAGLLVLLYVYNRKHR